MRGNQDYGRLRGTFKVTKYAGMPEYLARRPYLVGKPFPNILVNTGLAEIWNLITAQGGTAFSAANARLGVGDSSTAPATSQTDLLGTNKFRKAMDSGYPLAPVNGLEVFQSVYAAGEANFSWQEFAVFNAGSGGTMLNRSTSNQGTKISGQVWTLEYSITFS